MRWWSRWGYVAMLVVALWPVMGYGQSSTSFTFHSGATSVVNGNVMSAANFSTIVVQVEGVGGAFVGTVQFEKKTKDAAGYVAVQCTNANDRSVVSTTTSEAGYWECPGGAYSFRVPVTARTSGTIKVTGMGTTAVAGRGAGGGVTGWPSVNVPGGVTFANSEANCTRIGTATHYWCPYYDVTDGLILKPIPLGDTVIRAWPNFNVIVRDMEGAKDILTVDPDTGGTGVGTLTLTTSEQLVASNVGVEFTESDTNPTCAAGNYTIYADSSEAKLKKCTNGVASDLDTGGAGGAPTLVRRTSDSAAKNANTTLAADSVLLFPIGTTGFTTFALQVNYSSSTTADLKIDFSVPSGAAGRWNLHGYPTVGSSACGSNVGQTSDSLTTATPGIGGAGVGTICTVTLTGYVLSGGTAGNVDLRWAQNTSDATNTIVHAGSWLRYQTD